ILERRRERMLGGEAIVDVEHVRARGGGAAPGKTPEQLRGAAGMGPAVEIENAAVAARLAHGDANGVAPAGVDRSRLRACRRARNKGLDALEPAASRRQRHLLANVPLFHEAQAQPQKLGPHAHRLCEWPPMRAATPEARPVRAAISPALLPLKASSPPEPGRHALYGQGIKA